MEIVKMVHLQLNFKKNGYGNRENGSLTAKFPDKSDMEIVNIVHLQLNFRKNRYGNREYRSLAAKCQEKRRWKS